MTSAAQLLHQLHQAGVTITLDGTELVLVPAARVPAEIVPALREHKQEIMNRLDPKRYQQRFADPGPTETELKEIERQVRTTGICLTWCQELADYVAFVADDFDHSMIPPGFTAYTELELNHIAELSADGLRRVHAAKRTWAIVTGNRPEEKEMRP